ncbi:transcriptional protein SWT1-like isoform X2 [Ictalurus furcatus]|nr:transcriptional protein SWT1-like isoform X2 [Ictalurus furcatus]
MAEELLTSLRCRSPYSGRVDSALSCLKTLQQRLQPQKSPVDDRSGDTLMADAVQDVAPPLHASHQEVWALFESIWNNVCHVSSAVFSALHFSPGSAGSVEPRSTPPPQDGLSCLHRLNTALEQLLEAFQRSLPWNHTSLPRTCLSASLTRSTGYLREHTHPICFFCFFFCTVGHCRFNERHINALSKPQFL